MSDITELLPHVKLAFHLKHPTFEACYLDGYHCGAKEYSIEENPYDIHSREYEIWYEGWVAGFYAEENLFLEESQTSNNVIPFIPKKASNDQLFGVIKSQPRMHLMTNAVKKAAKNKVVQVATAIAGCALVGYSVLELMA